MLTRTILRRYNPCMEPRSAEHWEEEAHRWAAWARAPQHDAYWYYRDAFFALVPPAGRATLEVGFGEGRVSRDLVARGHRVTGVDVSPTLARLAAEADRTAHYLLADGAALPFGAGAFDLVVAYNSLMDVDDMPAVCAEIGRLDAKMDGCLSVPGAEGNPREGRSWSCRGSATMFRCRMIGGPGRTGARRLA